MAAPDASASSVDEEAALLKAALRSVLTGDSRPGPEPAEEQPEQDDHRGQGHHCLVCRANEYAHAVAPDLLDELGRGLAAAGRLAQDAAREMRRHTADVPPTTDHEGES